MRATTAPNPPDLDLGDSEAGDGAYDALAELFLGAPAPSRAAEAKPRLAPAPTASEPVGPVESPAPAPGAPARPLVEALVLGHLPFMSSPWAAQHAAATAEREAATVALVRLAAGHASVEVFGPGRTASSLEAADGDLAGALRAAARVVDRWIIRVDALDELSLVAHARVDAVTLLTSADEVAVVGAYRTLKTLTSPATLRAEPTIGDGLSPSLRVAIVGAPEARAARAAVRLKQAAEAFLGRPLDVAPPVERMGPLPSTKLHQGRSPVAAEDLMALLAGALTDAATRQGGVSGRSTRVVPPGAPARPRISHTDNADFTDPADEPREQSRDSAPSVVSATTPGASAPRATDVLLRAAPSSLPGAGAALSSHLPGLAPLAARCPYDESVELALDADGALHLLAPAADKAVESLAIVADWAATHARLLSLTAPRLDVARSARQHLFTDRPAASRRLLDSHVKVHLLKEVRVGERAAWCCVELN